MEKKVLLETSARHVHLTEEAIEILFGKGHTLTKKKDLSQPGQFACDERVTIVGSKKELPGVSVLGPARKANQVELSLTDARSIGVAAPIRESGDVAGTGACKIVGPCGEIEITEGVIAAKRHIHLDTKTAAEMALSDKQIVCVKVVSDGRTTIFGDVVVRVNENFAPAMHIDTDESNACAAPAGAMVEIIDCCCK